MESYQIVEHHSPQQARIAPHHREMLERESSISPEIVAGRGYQTVSRAEVPPEFKDYQRSAGLLMPVYSPNGITTGAQLRRDTPRACRGKRVRYETPAGARIVADVHPAMHQAAMDPQTPLWITEGVKKGDALASRGHPTVALLGVWMFRKKGTEEMLECFDHLPLRGRRVFVVFDSDVMVKPEVQMALDRLVGDLEERGAKVLVVYLEDAQDRSKVGVDDYLAAGGTVGEMKMLARQFEPQDMGRIRLSRDEQLRDAIGELWDRFWETPWVRFRGTEKHPHWMRGHTCRDAVKVLIDHAAKSGKVVDDGVRVTLAMRTWALKAKTSRRTLIKVVRHLEAEGWLRRDYEGRAEDAPGSYVLLAPRASLHQYGKRDGEGEGSEGTPEGGSDPGGEDLRAPRLRWSAPRFKPRRGVVKETRKVREAPPPQPRARIRRLGKVRGAILDALDAADGAATLQEIAEALHRKRPRDIRRRILPMLEEARILTVDGDLVSLADNWLEALDMARELGGEKAAEERDRVRYREQSEGFRNRHKIKPDPVPEKPPAGEIRELQRAPEVDPEVVDALRAFLGRNPFRRGEYPSWLANALWSEKLVPGKRPPPPESVELALAELAAAA